MADKNLGNEWKNTAYNLGEAFFELGKTIVHSVKKGVDIAYDYMNDKEDDKKKKTAGSKTKNSSDDEEIKVDGIIIEE